MKNYALFFLLASFFQTPTQAQSTLQATIVDAGSKEPLVGANVLIAELQKGGSSDAEGKIVLEGIPDGAFELRCSYLGYREAALPLSFPADDGALFTIELEPEGEELEAVTVSTTRSSRQIQSLPTRIEAITAEELGEQAAMNSANIAMLLKESTGIQVQQTSASSANQSIRIQGLDGRYTQILKDGFPLFGGFSGGLSVMQIPPLDLHQVEIIKGSISTLYGGGAIAGLVNLITKQPGDSPELNFMYTQTQALGSTLNGFYSQQYGRAGLTLYTSGHYQKAYDNNADDFTDLPQTKSISINPSFFYRFNETARLRIGLNTSFENRWGGDASLIKNG
ncbi:MAG: TonB-dependent receptor, partial [Phaeodactylibacter sp.]|nr:TonB-dependent receptor [Phaeodactylibacter sp.]